MLEFHVPGITHLNDVNMCLVSLFEDRRDWFYDDIAISGIYGSFFPCKWNGGRCPSDDLSDQDKRRRVICWYNDHGIGIYYTFTNKSLSFEDYYDLICNRDVRNILSRVDINKIIIADMSFRDYIIQTYSDYDIKFVLSTTSDMVLDWDVPALERAESEYDFIVLNHNLNNTRQIFDMRHPEKYEVLLNPQCVDNCEFESAHYKNVSNINAGIVRDEDYFVCPYGADKMHSLADMSKRRSFVTVDDLYTKYKSAGFRHFKINGRYAGWLNVVSYYIYYMIKPEYADAALKCFQECVSDPLFCAGNDMYMWRVC